MQDRKLKTVKYSSIYKSYIYPSTLKHCDIININISRTQLVNLSTAVCMKCHKCVRVNAHRPQAGLLSGAKLPCTCPPAAGRFTFGRKAPVYSIHAHWLQAGFLSGEPDLTIIWKEICPRHHVYIYVNEGSIYSPVNWKTLILLPNKTETRCINVKI